jgi:hypothetical protein
MRLSDWLLLQTSVNGITALPATYGDSSFGAHIRSNSDAALLRGDHGNTAMLKALIGLLTKTPLNDSARKPAPKAAAKSMAAGKDYRAAAVVPGIKCCLAAKTSVGKRSLFQDAPRLPLANCTMPTNCSCRFKKASDRRDGDRRQIGVSETGRWFAGPENRKRGSRRSVKD